MADTNFRPLIAGALIATAVSTGFFARGLAQPAPSPLRADPHSFRDVVKAALPAVVSIDARSSTAPGPKKQRRGQQQAEPPGGSFKRFMDDLEKKNEARPDFSIGFGSGFLIDAKGLVLTNHHVVEGAERVEITLSDGRTFSSRDFKGDERTDLAIIRFDAKGAKLPFLELGDSSQMEIGDRVLAIGAPFGLSGTVTNGIISAKGRDLGHERKFEEFLQTDAAINPGNSGGPLVSMDGKAIGVASAIKSESGGFQGIALAIPSNMAKEIVDKLVRDGVVKRGYLGIELVALSAEAAERYGVREGGVVVARVREKSPAAKCGLKADDAITTINDKSIKDVRELQRTVASIPLGVAVDLQILREGQPMTLKVTLEEEPKDYGARRPSADDVVTVAKAGLELFDVPAATAEKLGLDQDGGVIIGNVTRGSVAAKAGLQPGMVILKVNKTVVLKAAAARDAIEATIATAEGVTLKVHTGDGVSVIQLKTR